MWFVTHWWHHLFWVASLLPFSACASRSEVHACVWVLQPVLPLGDMLGGGRNNPCSSFGLSETGTHQTWGESSACRVAPLIPRILSGFCEWILHFHPLGSFGKENQPGLRAAKLFGHFQGDLGPQKSGIHCDTGGPTVQMWSGMTAIASCVRTGSPACVSWGDAPFKDRFEDKCSSSRAQVECGCLPQPCLEVGWKDQSHKCV